MSIPSRFSIVALGASAAALLAGCSGGGSSVAPNTALPPPPASVLASRSAQSALRRGSIGPSSGVDPRLVRPLRSAPVPVPDLSDGSIFKQLAVTDLESVSADIFNPQYQIVTTIKNGLEGPDGDWIDVSGNLYVADYANGVVDEYAPGASIPTTIYKTGIYDPVSVTTDRLSNVYVADYDSGGIIEFKQGSNTIKYHCPVPTGPVGFVGVAVDLAGDVFGSYNTTDTGQGYIAEYKSGLKGCSPTIFNIPLEYAGGLQITGLDTLAVVDEDAAVVDVIPKPYTSVASTISGASLPFHIALDQLDNRIFIVDFTNHDVLVDKFPSGTPVAVIGSANGLNVPAGVATYPYQK
jgi:hypothetical protein